MSKELENAKEALKHMTTGLVAIGELQKDLFKSLDPKTRENAIRYQEQYARLIASGDHVGAMRLSEKFKEDNK